MTPNPGLGMIPASQLASTGRTSPSDTGSMVNMDIHLAYGCVQLDISNKPRGAQPQNPRIQVRVLHDHPPGVTITGHLPTENPEGPKVLCIVGGVDPIGHKCGGSKKKAQARSQCNFLFDGSHASPPKLFFIRDYSIEFLHCLCELKFNAAFIVCSINRIFIRYRQKTA